MVISIKLILNLKNKFNIKVDINNDPEEETLNKFFSNYEKILLLNKEHKKYLRIYS